MDLHGDEDHHHYVIHDGDDHMVDLHDDKDHHHYVDNDDNNQKYCDDNHNDHIDCTKLIRSSQLTFVGSS